MSGLRIPAATYRLQFNRQFRFKDALALVPYLHRLGVSDLYASPILKARPGSSHGYDVTDPTRLNPELGTQAEFEALARELRQSRMGLLLDIVPNHMAASPENPWWMDFLEHGLCSPYAAFFDIDFSPVTSSQRGKVLLPVLGSPYREVLSKGELTLNLEDAGLFISYYQERLPLDVKSYHPVLSHRMDTLQGNDFARLGGLLNTLKGLSSVSAFSSRKAREQYRKRLAAREEFLRLIAASPRIKTFLLRNISLFNDRRNHALLDRLLEQQAYRLAFWKTAYKELNYRRFFDINDLIGIRVEEPHTFEATHALVFRLIREGKVTGLRIDHVDGLYDPLQYLTRLQRYIAPAEPDKSLNFYVVVEKILSGDEALPEKWPVCGTTGYDFLNRLSAFFVDREGVQALSEIYSRFTGSPASFEDVVYEKKRQVTKELLPSEIGALGRYLAHLAREHGYAITTEDLAEALAEITARLPVYRTYIRTAKISHQDRLYMEHSIRKAQDRQPALEPHALDFLRRVLLLDFPSALAPKQKKAWLRFLLRWQQLTGAVMAKGFEDTALYNYSRLLSLNEVGGNPASAGLSVKELHDYNLDRRARWPYSLNATATHDTKRGEDIRARLNVLSEIPLEWQANLSRWSQWNQAKKRLLNGTPVPGPDMEMLLYQTLIGACPLAESEIAEFKKRLNSYLIKASREAKVHSSWLSPDQEYEDALIDFTDSILGTSPQNEFLKDFLRFQKKIAYYGALNSLGQVLLKCTAPGVPDFYQGTELWDLSLVDPDNRRPVDFGRRIRLLNELMQQENRGLQPLIGQMLGSWQDGRVKLYLTCKALNARRASGDLFLDGNYVPIQVAGRRQEHICAFGRCKQGAWALVIVPRLLTGLVPVGSFPLGAEVWKDELLFLPQDSPRCWLNALTGEKLEVSGSGKELPLSDILRTFPVALLMST